MTDGTPESEAAILKKYGARTLETPYGSITIPGLNEAGIRKALREEMTYQHIKADREWTESHRRSASNAAAAQVDLFNRLKGVSDENSLRDIVNSWEAELDGVQLVHEDRQKMLAWAKDVREKGAEDQIPVDSYESGLWYRAQMGQLSLTDLDKELSTKVGRGLSAKTAYAISVRVGGVAMAASKAAWGDAQQSLYAELVKKTSTSDFLTGVGISDAQMGAVNSAFRELHEEMARRPDATKTQILGIWQSLAEKYKDQALGRTGLPGKVIPGISLDNFYEKLLEEANTPGWTYRPEDWNATIRMVFPNPKNELDRTLIKHASSEVLKGAKSETEGKWEPGEDLTKGAKRKMK